MAEHRNRYEETSRILNTSLAEIPASDLSVLYRTGRAMLLSGSGRDKRYSYRHGVMTRIGDIEAEQWKSLAKQWIEANGEKTLFEHVLEWTQEHHVGKPAKAELEMDALETHMRRLFDNPLWYGFVGFNRKYRPEVLANAELVTITCACCNHPGQVPMAVVRGAGNDGCIPCPVCGQWSEYEIE